MAQEKIDDFMEYAKYYAQAEKDLGVQSWVYISIHYKDYEGNIRKLFSYDLPRSVYERRTWVIKWRQAKLKCTFPKEDVSCTFCYYDKRLGNDPKLTDDLKTLTAAKAQVTKVQNQIDSYVKHERENNIFFDEATDKDLIKAKEKLALKKSNVDAAEKRMYEKINQINSRKI